MAGGITRINHPITFNKVYAISSVTYLNLTTNNTATVAYISGGWSISDCTTTTLTRNGDTNGLNLFRRFILIGA